MLAIRLLAGHVISEFLCQPKAIVQKKSEEWSYSILHIAIVFFMMMVCTVGYWSLKLVLALSVISAVHITDRFLANKIKGLWGLVINQSIHIVIIMLVPALFGIWPMGKIINEVELVYNDPRLWVYILGYTAGVWGGSVVIGKILSSMTKSNEEQAVSKLAANIGVVERLLIISLALLNQYTAIGFIFAVKGVARKVYAESNESKGEIYFLGTGLSFFIGIITAFIIKWLLGMV